MDCAYENWFRSQIKTKDIRKLIAMRNFIAKLFTDINANRDPQHFHENKEMMHILSDQWILIKRELSCR